MKEGGRDITGVLTVIANMVEDFSLLTPEELIKSPIIHFPKNRFKMGEVKPYETKRAELEFENKGKRDLIVHNINISNDSYKLQYFDRIIKPGNKGKIIVSIKPINTTNNLRSNIIVISNDPKHSSVNLIAQGSFKKNVIKIEKEKININEKDAYFLFKEFKGKDVLVILDVRSKEEFENNHIPDAINIDFCNKNFFEILKLLDKSKVYLVYSKSGMLSEEAVMMMKELKFERFHNMKKGIIGWEKSGYPLKK